jgi:hypothetical protein
MDRDWTASFSTRFRNGTCITILDNEYNIANSSCHFGSYGSIWTGPSPKQYYMDLRSSGPYTIFLVTDRSIYCHMTLSAMNYLLFIAYTGYHSFINLIDHHSTIDITMHLNSDNTLFVQHGIMNKRHTVGTFPK